MYNKWNTTLFGFLLIFSFQISAVEYQLPDTEGQMQSLDQYQGKWVIVNYWATWCGTCMKELPDLVSLHEDNKDKDIVVVGVNFEAIGNDQLKAFVAEQSIPYPVLRSEPVPITAVGKVPALPTTYIIDPDGKITQIQSTYQIPQMFAKMFQDAMKQEGEPMPTPALADRMGRNVAIAEKSYESALEDLQALDDISGALQGLGSQLKQMLDAGQPVPMELRAKYAGLRQEYDRLKQATQR